MKYVTIIKAVLITVFIIFNQGLAMAENPLFMPNVEKSLPLMSRAEADELKTEAEGLKRKAELLKVTANKKYTAASDLRKKAGGFRSESSQKGEILRSQAEQSAALSSFIGDMFGLISNMGGTGGGQLSANSAMTASLTGKIIQGQQAMDAKGVMNAQGQAGQMSLEAEKKAGPLEMRADELENEGNRLMEAHNRLIAIANAKFLLVAADDLLRKVDGDNRLLEELKENSRQLVASMTGP